MPFASSSLAVVRAIKESTFGVTPVAGNSSALRITGESLDYAISKEASKEINGTRTISSKVPVGATANGGVTQEMHYAGVEPFLESTLQSTFTEFGTDGVGVATPTTSISTTAITATSATSGSSIFTNLQKGQWFRITSAGANNGKILRVSTVTAPTTTVITLDTNTPAVVSAGESIQVQTARLTHGTTQTSWTIERENPDIGVFVAYTGQTPSKMGLKVASGSLTEVTFDFMGKAGIESNTTVMPGSPIAAPTYDIHSGVGGATNAIWLDGVPLTGTFVKSVDLSFDNGLRNQDGIGTLGSVGIGSGTIDCKLNMSLYFADKSLFTKFRTNANTSVIFSSTDAAGNGYIFTVPVGNLATYKSNSDAKDKDQMVDVEITALSDTGNAVSALRKLIFIDRIGVAVV
jgi:hypothetical protein